LALAIPSLNSRRQWHELRGWLPLVGTVLRSASLSGMFRLLADLVEAGIPLPESLRIAAAVNYDAALAAGAERISVHLVDGQTPLAAVADSEAFPRDVVPIFRWADRRSLFVESLRAAGDIYAARSRLQSGVMAVVLEPVLVLGVGLTAGFVVLALFMPLIKLLNDLS
jgi:type II secretory pathway component PulF